jgi:guanine deaminase
VAALRDLLSFGTTAICAYATVHAAGTRAAFVSARELGIRAAIGQVLMDRNAPVELIRPASQLLAEARLLAAEFPPPRSGNAPCGAEPRPEFVLTPRFAITCTAELLAGAAQIASVHKNLIQTHLAENLGECQVTRQLFPDRSYTQVYAAAGLLTPRTLCAHAIYLSGEETALLAAHQTTLAHCPTANTFLQSGIMPRANWVRAGLRQAVGSDIGAGTDRSMLRVAKAMLDSAKIFRLNEPQAALPSPAEAWWQITAGNAAALHWDNVGKIALGCAADLVIARPAELWLQSPDPLSYALYAWDDRWLQTTIVAGKIAWQSRSTGSAVPR